MRLFSFELPAGAVAYVRAKTEVAAREKMRVTFYKGCPVESFPLMGSLPASFRIDWGR